MQDRYHTADLGITAYLTYDRRPMVDLDTSDPRRMMFIFDMPEEEGLAIQRQWWNGTLKVDPKGFYNAISQVKDMIHGRRREMLG